MKERWSEEKEKERKEDNKKKINPFLRTLGTVIGDFTYAT